MPSVVLRRFASQYTWRVSECVNHSRRLGKILTGTRHGEVCGSLALFPPDPSVPALRSSTEPDQSGMRSGLPRRAKKRAVKRGRVLDDSLTAGAGRGSDQQPAYDMPQGNSIRDRQDRLAHGEDSCPFRSTHDLRHAVAGRSDLKDPFRSKRSPSPRAAMGPVYYTANGSISLASRRRATWSRRLIVPSGASNRLLISSND